MVEASQDEDAGVEEPARPLLGTRVCMLRSTDYSIDARARKQTASLLEAGAQVRMIGIGEAVPAHLADAGWDVRIGPCPNPPRAPLPRLGQEDVWWPLRVAVNLSYTRIVASRFRRQRATVFPYEGVLADMATEFKPDVVHAHNIHTLGAAVLVKERTGAKVVYDCRDVFSEVDYIDRRLRRRLRRWESSLVRDVDAVISVSEALAKAIEGEFGISRPVAIYNGPQAVAESISPVHDTVRLFFQGAFMAHRNLAALISAMPLLGEKATLTLQGFGGQERELHDQVAVMGLEGIVEFIPPVGPHEVIHSATAYDVGVICHEGTNLNMRSAVPNKLMDYLGAGLAVAASDLPGHRSVLEGTGAAVFIDPSSSETLAWDLLALLEHPERITEMKAAALTTAREYEWPVQAAKLLKVYQSVIGQTQ